MLGRSFQSKGMLGRMLEACCRGDILSARGEGEHCWRDHLCGRTWAGDETNLLIPARESDTWSLGALRDGSWGVTELPV